MPEHRVDVTIMQLDAALAGRCAGASKDDVDHPLLLLEGAGGSVAMLGLLVSPGRAVPATAATGASGATRPLAIIEPGSLGLLWSDAVGEGMALTRCVVGILVPGTFGIKELVELLLVEGGALLGSIGDDNSVVGAMLAITGLGRLGTVTVLAVSWRTIVAEPPELSRLKCAGHHHKGNTNSNALQTEQFLVCRVTSRFNHRISDRTSIPHTKANPEILQPYILQHRHISYYNKFKVLLQVQTQKNVIQNISLKFRV